jgi:hypothetical protein
MEPDRMLMRIYSVTPCPFSITTFSSFLGLFSVTNNRSEDVWTALEQEIYARF